VKRRFSPKRWPETERTRYLISRKVGKALHDHGMISNGDKILVAVSGGKDSLTLLDILRGRSRSSPVKYEIIVAHIDIDFQRFDRSGLMQYLEEMGYRYYIRKLRVRGKAQYVDCFYCAWSRKMQLFDMAEKLGCRKIAIAHHLEDAIETFFLNLLYHAEISTMPPAQSFFGGKFCLIRPLIYVPEEEIIRYARVHDLPVIDFSCPYEGRKRRFVRDILERLEGDSKGAKSNIFWALRAERIKKRYLLDSPPCDKNKQGEDK
jgi:tRNA 2-thiocytidine biosynthesis protein TtcA